MTATFLHSLGNVEMCSGGLVLQDKAGDMVAVSTFGSPARRHVSGFSLSKIILSYVYHALLVWLAGNGRLVE